MPGKAEWKMEGKKPKQNNLTQKPLLTGGLKLSTKASTKTPASLSSTGCGVPTAMLSLIKKKNTTLNKCILNNSAVYLCISKKIQKYLSIVYLSQSKLLFFFIPFHFLVICKPFI